MMDRPNGLLLPPKVVAAAMRLVAAHTIYMDTFEETGNNQDYNDVLEFYTINKNNMPYWQESLLLSLWRGEVIKHTVAYIVHCL